MRNFAKISPILVVKNLVFIMYLTAVIYAAMAVANQAGSQYFADASHYSETDAVAARSIEYDSGNPDAFKMRGIFFLNNENYPEAIANFEKAAKLRPNDYLLWLRLGYAKYKLEDYDSALVGYDKAIALAPNYAMPKRYKGRLFLKINKPDLAFVNLSQAAALEPTYMRELLHLARMAYPQKPESIERAVRPVSIEAKKSTALYFIRYKMMSDGLSRFLLGNDLSRAEKDEFVTRLIEANDFKLAFSIWKSKNNRIKKDNLMENGDFESDVNPDERNFGWVLQENVENVGLSIEGTDPFSKKAALKVTYRGNSAPLKPVISQLLPVEPNRRYRLKFAARAEELVSGGLPVIDVIDGVSRAVIIKSEMLTSDKWYSQTLDFRTGLQTTVIVISLQRMPCKTNPCPVFGELWLDNFELSS